MRRLLILGSETMRNCGRWNRVRRSTRDSHTRTMQGSDQMAIDFVMGPGDRIRRNGNVDEEVGEPDFETGVERCQNFDEINAFVDHHDSVLTARQLHSSYARGSR